MTAKHDAMNKLITLLAKHAGDSAKLLLDQYEEKWKFVQTYKDYLPVENVDEFKHPDFFIKALKEIITDD